MKRLLIISAALLVGILNSVPTAHANGDKILICHIAPGNPDNAHEITIDDSAWPAHEAHGDYLGFCQSGVPGPAAF
jgi:hypothetical protein